MAKITIIGIGHGGFAVAADMTLAGHEVTFYVAERYKNRVERLFEEKTIHLSGVGRTGTAHLVSVTSSPEEAFANDIIIPVVPAYAQERFANEIAAYLRPGHKLLLVPGSTGGALVTARVLKEHQKLDGVVISEMHTLPYACRKTGECSVEILLECGILYFAAFPAKYNQEMFEIAKSLYPATELVSDVLETAINNGNPISHPVPMVLNAGRVEDESVQNYHYRGITPSVARVIETLEEERKEIVEVLGYDYISSTKRLELTHYAPKRDTLYEAYRDSKVFHALMGPNSLENRYLTEDTPYSLRAIVAIGKFLGVKTPNMEAIITIGSALMGADYMTNGRTMKTMGLVNIERDEIKDFLYNGYSN
ncbi:MAG: NAD/NADP octopine/nopaline dehydrogenase family protein [Clostridia bacterium]|nr:NAD/NADP octopine/nopaline dehydrogenase family protein [Clostridia bacterium]